MYTFAPSIGLTSRSLNCFFLICRFVSYSICSVCLRVRNISLIHIIIRVLCCCFVVGPVFPRSLFFSFVFSFFLVVAAVVCLLGFWFLLLLFWVLFVVVWVLFV